MMSKTLCTAFGLVAAAVAQPQISSDSTDITLSALSGDINIATGEFTCNGGPSTCGLGAALTSIMTTQTAQSSLIAAQSSTIAAMNASLVTDYATRNLLETYDAATREFALDLVEELANLTNTSVDTIVQSHLDLGVLHANKTLVTNLVITSDADFTSLLPLLNHVEHILGDVQISDLGGIKNIMGAFANLQTVTGDVSIQRCNGLTNLSMAFNSVTSIGGDIIIRYNNNLQSYGNAFANLLSLGGTLAITGNPNAGNSVGAMLSSLQTLEGQPLTNFDPATQIYLGDAVIYPSGTGSLTQTFTTYAALESRLSQVVLLTGSLYLRDLPSSVTNISGLGPQLKSVGGQVYLYNNAGITSLQNLFPNLRSVASNVYVWQCNAVQSASGFMQNVETIGGQIYVYYNRQLTTMENAFNALTTLGNRLYIYNNDQMTMMPKFPVLQTTLDLYAFSNDAMAFDNTYFPMLKSCRNLQITQGARTVTSLNGIFPELVNATGQIYIGNFDYVTSMDNAFPKVQTIGTYLQVYYLRRLQSMGGTTFGQLRSTRGLRIYYCFSYAAPGVTQNLNGAFPQLTSVGTYGLYIYRCQYLASMSNFAPLLTQVDGYIYFYWNTGLTTLGSGQAMAFRRVTSVGTYIYFYRNGFTSLNGLFPALTSVGSYVNIFYNTALTSMNGAFPLVATIGQSFSFQSNGGTGSTSPALTLTNSFPLLRSVGTYFYLNNNRRLTDISGSFVLLRTVGTNLYIYNNQLTARVLVNGRWTYTYSGLDSVGNAFSSLQAGSGVGSTLMFYRNGNTTRSVGFCTSADQYLCPSTTSRSTSGGSAAGAAYYCCQTFCASSTAC